MRGHKGVDANEKEGITQFSPLLNYNIFLILVVGFTTRITEIHLEQRFRFNLAHVLSHSIPIFPFS